MTQNIETTKKSTEDSLSALSARNKESIIKVKEGGLAHSHSNSLISGGIDKSSPKLVSTTH
jgi:hypothetical protein